MNPLGPADYARACVESLVAGARPPKPPAGPFYERPAACFVSLKRFGELRGCIGTLEPAEPGLGDEIARNARSAAFHDPRFPPLRDDELEGLACSVDVLSESEPCALGDLDPQRYGVIVAAGARRGVLLPDLVDIDTVEQQVAVALQKAGIRPDERFSTRRFRVDRFREGEQAEGSAARAGGDD